MSEKCFWMVNKCVWSIPRTLKGFTTDACEGLVAVKQLPSSEAVFNTYSTNRHNGISKKVSS